jgi:2-iminoacetate synthase ThiH
MDKDVDEGGRTVDEVSRILQEMGMIPATREEYERYLKRIRHD